MGRKRQHPYLKLRNGIYYVDKVVRVGAKARYLRQSTGSRDEAEAEQVALVLIQQEQNRLLYGLPIEHTFEEGAVRLLEMTDRDRQNDVYHLDALMPHLGNVKLFELHSQHDAVQGFIDARRKAGKANNTINRSLEKVNLILNLATEWRDGDTPWLRTAPRIRLLPRRDKRHPAGSEAPGYPLSPGEARTLFTELERYPHWHDMALYGLHTGCREGEMVNLRWDWMRELPEAGILVFHLPDSKNGQPRLIVCNSTAKEVVERQRGKHPTHVFTFRGRPVSKINSNGWRAARRRAGLNDKRGRGKHFRVHDLRTTFATWLRERGVSVEDRKALMGHANGDITTHYSSAEVSKLYEAVEKLVSWEERPSLYVVKTATG